MKKRVLSVLLCMCMLFSLLPTTALADEAGYIEVKTYTELDTALKNAAATTIVIVGSRCDYSTNYKTVTFDWEGKTSLDLEAVNSSCDIKISGIWTVPKDVTVNVKDDVIMGGASSDIVVDGTWNLAKTSCSVTSNFDDATLTISTGGVLTTSLPSVACWGTLELKGKMKLPGSLCQLKTLILGDGAEVINTSNYPKTNVIRLQVIADGEISCPEGSATIQGTVCGNIINNIETAKEETYTLSGNLTVDEILLKGNKTMVISSGSYITTKKLTSNDTTYLPALDIDGTLELNGAAGTNHSFSGGMSSNISSTGVLILRPGNTLDSETSTAEITGNGIIKLFADYDGTTYSSKPALFGNSDSKPDQIKYEPESESEPGSNITIWRNWSGVVEPTPGTGEEEPATGHVVNYTYPEDLCDLVVIDNNGEFINSGDTIAVDENNSASAFFQIDVEKGYELDSVRLNGDDVTTSFQAEENTAAGTTAYMATLQLTKDTDIVITLKQTSSSGEEGGGSGNEGGTGGDSGDTSDLHKLSAPTNLHWGTFYTNQVTGDGFSYPGMISWKVADPSYDQILEIALYKGDVLQYTTEWDYYADAENPRVYRCDWDFSLSELDRGNGVYHFTVQAKGDGTTTSDSEIVPSPDWEYKKPTAQLTAPEIIGWSGTTAQWNTVSGENVGGYVVDFYYSADKTNATSTDDVKRISGYVKYNGEGGDPMTFREIPEDRLAQYGNGYYYFTVRTVSADVSTIQHSLPSELSAAYHYTGSAGGDTTCQHTGGTATCTEQAICDLCEQPYGSLADHSWETEWTTSETQHWHECANCDAKSDVANHDSDTAATCTQKAVCDACTQAYGEEADHSWKTEWTTNETQHWHKCANCDETTAKGNHVPVTDAYVAPTLNSTGLTEGSHCGTCDKVLVEQETIAKLEYQEVYFLPPSSSWTYGDEAIKNGLMTYAYNDSVSNAELAYASKNPAVATVDASGKITVVGAGTAIITATAPAVKDQYAETVAEYTLTVNKAALTVTAKDKTITYGAAPANDGYTVSGLVNGDTESVLTGTAAYTCDYAQYGKVGTYPIALSGLSAKNYDITFEPGTLTVEKASAYTITLGNLTQNVGSVSAVTAVVAPQDSTAMVKVEYETVTAAKACGHQHDSACGENGTACTHTGHDETCGYAAETRTWGTTVPTAKGTYNVRASLTASENLVVPAEPVYTTGSLEIKAQATIGGGNSSGSSSSNKNDSLEMGSGSNSVAVDVKVENGSAEVVVTDKDLEKILDNVPASGEMVVDLTSVNGAEELVLPAKLVEALSESSETKELTVVSEAAEITMGADVMETLVETISGTNDKVSVELTAVDKKDLTQAQQKALDSITVDAVIVELTMMVNHYDEKGKSTGETQLHELGGKVDVRVAYELPKNMAGKHVVVSYVSDNGTVTYLRANYVDGYVSFTTDHFSTYAVFVNHAASFQDIDLNAWYAANVDFVAANGLMTGTSDTTFNPGGKVSRQQTWMILARMAGYAPEDMAAAKGWAVSTGVSDGTGAVNAVTRQQLVTLLWRAEGAPEGDLSVLAAYPDAGSVSEYARKAMAWAVESGVIGGTAQGTLNPQGTASRTQLAAILHRYADGIEN